MMKKSVKKKKSYFEMHKREIIIGAVLVVVILACIIFLLVNKKNDNGNSNANNNNENNVVEQDNDSSKVTEKDIIEAYGFSKEDAIKLVETAFNSDNFTYKVVVNDEGKYIVTALNTIDNKEYLFEVDPMSRTYAEL